MQLKITTLILAIGATAVALSGCKRPGDETHGDTHVNGAIPPDNAGPEVNRQPDPAASESVQAQMNPTEGNQAVGLVTFTKVPGGIQVTVDINGLTPGMHGFHIHEVGDCSAPDASSAGGHFNPSGHAHGAQDAAERHVGDFGNLEADASGRAQRQFLDTHIAFDGPNSIIGRGLIVHADPDDLKTQPTGNSGKRVACGVIGSPGQQTGTPPAAPTPAQ